MNRPQLFRNRIKQAAGIAAGMMVVSSLAVVGITSSAGASVSRYQIETLQYTFTVAGGYVHGYTFTVNPCDGTFTATGEYPALPTTPTVYYETLKGSTDGLGGLTFTGYYYSDPAFTSPTGYQFTFTGSFTDLNLDIAGTVSDNGGNVGLTATGTASSSPTFSNYGNHGQYVKAMGGGADAAHSCIGMPIQSQS